MTEREEERALQDVLDEVRWLAPRDAEKVLQRASEIVTSAREDYERDLGYRRGGQAMRITPCNKDEAIEMLRGRALLLLMSDEVASLEGEFAAPLWELVGSMDEAEARDAIRAFDATQ